MENIFFAFILPFIGVLHLIGCKVLDYMPLIVKLYDFHCHANVVDWSITSIGFSLLDAFNNV